MKGPVAPPGRRVGDANGGHAVLHRDAVGTGEGTEVAVERAVLLHDDDHVADLVDARRYDIGARRATGDPLDVCGRCPQADKTRHHQHRGPGQGVGPAPHPERVPAAGGTPTRAASGSQWGRKRIHTAGMLGRSLRRRTITTGHGVPRSVPRLPTAPGQDDTGARDLH